MHFSSELNSWFGLELIDLTMTKRNAGFHMTSITFAFQKISYRKENDVENKNFIIRKDESSTINKKNIKWYITWEQQVLYENLFMTVWQILFLTAKRSYFIGKDEYKMNKYNTKWGISEMKNNWKLFLNNEKWYYK